MRNIRNYWMKIFPKYKLTVLFVLSGLQFLSALHLHFVRLLVHDIKYCFRYFILPPLRNYQWKVFVHLLIRFKQLQTTTNPLQATTDNNQSTSINYKTTINPLQATTDSNQSTSINYKQQPIHFKQLQTTTNPLQSTTNNNQSTSINYKQQSIHFKQLQTATNPLQSTTNNNQSTSINYKQQSNPLQATTDSNQSTSINYKQQTNHFKQLQTTTNPLQATTNNNQSTSSNYRQQPIHFKQLQTTTNPLQSTTNNNQSTSSNYKQPIESSHTSHYKTNNEGLGRTPHQLQIRTSNNQRKVSCQGPPQDRKIPKSGSTTGQKEYFYSNFIIHSYNNIY